MDRVRQYNEMNDTGVRSMDKKIARTASAGTVESSDCLVTVSPSEIFLFEYSGPNSTAFKKRTDTLVRTTLEQYGIKQASITIQDQGALEMTVRARLAVALERAAETTNEE